MLTIPIQPMFASMAGTKQLVVSLMGSDINSHWINKIIIRFLT
jgi:hypothetical protein